MKDWVEPEQSVKAGAESGTREGHALIGAGTEESTEESML